MSHVLFFRNNYIATSMKHSKEEGTIKVVAEQSKSGLVIYYTSDSQELTIALDITTKWKLDTHHADYFIFAFAETWVGKDVSFDSIIKDTVI